MLGTIIYLDGETLTYIGAGLAVLMVLIAVSPIRPRKDEPTYGKIFAGLALVIVVVFALVVALYGRP